MISRLLNSSGFNVSNKLANASKMVLANGGEIRNTTIPA